MGIRLAHRSDAIVAAGACARNIGMVEHGAGPDHSIVAAAAIGARHHVSGRLADGLLAIVAAGAGARYGRMIEAGAGITGGGVAAVALGSRLDVVRRLARGALIVVTTAATLGRYLCERGCMAPFAGYVGVNAGEWKAGLVVIEGCRLDGLRPPGWRQEQ
jgi:hypothetical protein